MSDRQLLVNLARGRLVIGVVLLLFPRLVARIWAGPDGASTAGSLLGRALGIRDIVLAVGLLEALQDGRGDTLAADDRARPWVAYAATADSIDAVATALHRPRQAWPTIVLAGGAAGLAARTLLSEPTR